MTDPSSHARWLIPLIVVSVAAGVRLWGITSPDRFYWDEQFYVDDAEVYLGGGIAQPIDGAPPVAIADEGTWVHPPGGKWIIALLGVGPFGNRPIGWRLPSALFGIAGVALVYLLAFRLWRTVWSAGFAASLLALDGLHIVQSRIAMLDIFLTTFVTAGMLFIVLDRQRGDARDGPGRWSRLDAVFGSPYRFWAGACFGAAVATKWSGAFGLILAAGLSTVWAFTGDRRHDRSGLGILGTLAASFVLVPLGVYLLSYGSFFFQHGVAIHDFIALQLRMLRYQQQHIRFQPENSRPWTWPLLLDPIRYFRAGAGNAVTTVVALGNPALWWGFLILIPVGLFTITRKATWQHALIFGGYLAMYLPWLAVPRTQFLFYMLPAVPFMCLAVVAILRELPRPMAPAAGVVVLAIVSATAVLFLPVWTGWPTSVSWLGRLRLLPHWPL